MTRIPSHKPIRPLEILVSSGIALTLVFLGIPGCGGGGDEPTTPSSNANGDRPEVNPSPSDGPQVAHNNTGNGKSPVRTDENGRKWIGEIPYDVWYQDPLAVASNETPVGSGNSPKSSSPDGMTKKAGGQQSENNGGNPSEPKDNGETVASVDQQKTSSGGNLPEALGSSWKAVAPIDVLDGEVTEIRNTLTQSMRTVGQYNGNYKKIRMHGATLAALGGIVGQHSGSTSWKDKAAYVRDLGQKIAEGAQGLGRKNFEATQLPYEQFVDVLNGNQPAGMETPKPSVDFSQRAPRNELMKRMEHSFQWLKKNIKSQDDLKAEAETIRQESGILAALTKVIATSGYDSAGDKGYQNFAQELIKASHDMHKAVESESIDDYEDAVGRAQNSCSQCHTEYRFADVF